MNDIISCPRCQKSLSVPADLRGQAVECPSCGVQFTAAGDSPASGPSAVFRSTDQDSGAADARASWQDSRPGDDYDDDAADDRRQIRRDLEPHRGTLVLILGILSIVSTVLALVCAVFGIGGVILGPIAWVMGGNDLKRIKAGAMDPDGRGMTQAGWICGIIGTIVGALLLIVTLLFLVFFLVMIAAAAK